MQQDKNETQILHTQADGETQVLADDAGRAAGAHRGDDCSGGCTAENGNDDDKRDNDDDEQRQALGPSHPMILAPRVIANCDGVSSILVIASHDQGGIYRAVDSFNVINHGKCVTLVVRHGHKEESTIVTFRMQSDEHVKLCTSTIMRAMERFIIQGEPYLKLCQQNSGEDLVISWGL